MAKAGAKKLKMSIDNHKGNDTRSVAKRRHSESSQSSSESESESELSLDEQIDEDSGEDRVDSESSGESESDEEVKEAKKSTDGFGDAMSAILGSRIKAHDAKDPVLIRNKRPAREIEEAKEEAKVRKAIRAEQRLHKDKARVKDVIPKDPELAGVKLQHEKILRKTAQRGVVKLMNAIHSAQASGSSDTSGTVKKQDQETATELSKERFLDMIRSG